MENEKNTKPVSNITVWKQDKPHSQLMFSIVHLMGISKITGSFTDFDVNLQSQQEDFSDVLFEMRVNTASIGSGVPPRDAHLNSAEFFDTTSYPEAIIQTNSIEKKGANHYKLTGNITIKNVTKPIELDAIFNGSKINPFNKDILTAGFKVTGTLNRNDFGIGTVFPDALISNKIEITATGEFQKQL